MARRSLLTLSSRQELFGIPDDQVHLLRYYVLSREDIDLIRTRRRDQNRLGLAVHISLLRYPGQGWLEGMELPESFVAWLTEQLALPDTQLAEYADRRQIRSEHHLLAMRHLDLLPFEATHFESTTNLAARAAFATDHGADIMTMMIAGLREQRLVLPSMDTLERVALKGRAQARRQAAAAIFEGISSDTRDALHGLLVNDPSLGQSRLTWLRGYPHSTSPASMHALLTRIRFLRKINLGSVYKSYAFMTCSFSNQRDRPTMDHKQFQDWLSGIDHLSPAQRQEAETVFMGVSEASSSLAAIEASVGESRQCPHCGTPGAISRGKARGLRRYQCKGCNKTFNAATGTPLSGLHRKDKWLAFGTCLSDGLTVRASAERCKFAVNTAFRWRHRFLTTDNPKARKLTGIVEVDETYVLQSQKGERNLERKARRRGGKARKRGLSDEQVPVLVAADRSGMTVSAVLPAVNADTLQSAIEPVVDDDIVLVTDGHRAYPPCAAALGVRHEALNLSGGERVRVRDAFHIQTVNNRHSQLKDFLRRYRGVATKYLDNYLRWFQRLQLENASPRACRATAIADPCIRFVN